MEYWEPRAQGCAESENYMENAKRKEVSSSVARIGVIETAVMLLKLGRKLGRADDPPRSY